MATAIYHMSFGETSYLSIQPLPSQLVAVSKAMAIALVAKIMEGGRLDHRRRHSVFSHRKEKRLHLQCRVYGVISTRTSSKEPQGHARLGHHDTCQVKRELFVHIEALVSVMASQGETFNWICF